MAKDDDKREDGSIGEEGARGDELSPKEIIQEQSDNHAESTTDHNSSNENPVTVASEENVVDDSLADGEATVSKEIEEVATEAVVVDDSLTDGEAPVSKEIEEVATEAVVVDDSLADGEATVSKEIEEVATEAVVISDSLADGEAPVSKEIEEVATEVGAISDVVTEASPAEDGKKKGFALPSPKVLILGAVALVLLIVAVVIGTNISRNSKIDIPVASVLISVYDDDDFETTGTFSLSGLEGFSKEYLESNLYFDPDVKFTVTKDGKEYIIAFEDYQNISYLGYFPYYNLEGEESVEVFRVNRSNLTVSIINEHVFADSAITLEFSEQVDVRSLEENLTISPSTAFTMSYDLDMVTIYPDTQWNNTAKYTISIGAGYTSTNGKQFNGEQVLKFHIVRYDDNGNIVLYYPEIDFRNDDSFIITKDVNMLLTFNGELLEKPIPVTIETYRLGDVEKFKTQGLIYLDYEVDLSRIEKIGTDAFLIENGKNQFEIKNPGEGAYVLSIKYNDPYDNSEIEARTSYLITPYSMYLQSSRNETLAWVHRSDLNGDTGGPVEGFTVVFNEDSEKQVVTNEKGIAILPNVQEVLDETKEEEEEDYYYYYYNDRKTEIVDVSVYDGDGKLVYYDNAKLRLNSLERRDSFYSYLFTDRTIYRPTDTIQIWGFIKAFRTNDNPLPKTVTAIFDPDGLNMEVECAVDAFGAFTGEIALEQIRSTQYDLRTVVTYPADPNVEGAKDVTMILNTEYLTVKDFQKPTYVIKSTTDKELYQKGDTVNVSVTPTFYDGTPLPDFPLEVYTREDYNGEWKRLDDITTDNEGNATFSFPVPDVPESDYYYSYFGATSNYFRVQISSDGQQITNVNDYTCFYPETMVETIIENQTDGKNLMMTVNTYKIDLTKPSFLKSFVELKGRNWEIFSLENLLKTAKGEPVDMTVDVGLRWRYQDTNGIVHQNRRRSLSEGYYAFDNWYGFDYRYVPPEDIEVVDSWETQEKNISVTTKNGTAIVSNLIFTPKGTTINFDEKYYLRSYVSYTDTNKQLYDEYSYYPDRASLYNWAYDDSDDEKPKGFTYQVTDTVTNEDLTPTSYYYRSSLVAAGNKTNFELLYNGDKIDKHGTILYSTIQNGLYEYNVVDANQFDFTYIAEYGPELTILGAYFDGYRVHYIEDIGLRVDSTTLNLNIDVTSDKINYTPGDDVTLQIKTTDIEGNGVAGNLIVAVVDEAVFAVSEQNINVYYDLFDNFWYLDNYVSKYCTTYRAGGANYELWSGGKGEGEGGEFYDSYRKNFKDTASFIPTRTDASGNATVSFTLPDNVTSWRITTVEIGDDLTSGTGKTNIISTLPFFTQPVVSNKYIEGDEISMLVQGHGISLETDSEIDYTITLVGDGFNKTLTTKGKAYQPWEFNFGVLPMGSYTLIAKSQFGGYSDTVELPVHVIKSNLELVINTPIAVKLNQQLDISALRYPVSLTLYDKENAAFYDTISSLFGHYCMMPSQRMSRFVAKQVLRDTLGEDEDIPYYIAKGNDSVSDMQQYDGGIGAAADSNSELMLSMYMTMIAGDQFNQTTLAEYYRGQIEILSVSAGSNATDEVIHNRQKNIAAAHLGLAAIGQVEKEEIYTILGLDKDGKSTTSGPLRRDIKAYYITALAYLGDDKVAKSLYESELKGIISEIPTTINYDYYYNYTVKDLNLQRDLSAIWIASSKINQGDAVKIAEYYNQFYWRYRSLFEGMIFALNYKMVDNNLTFSYTMEGKTVSDKVGFRGAKTIVLNKSQLENLRFNQLDAGVSINAYYVGEPTELNITQSDDLSVVKTVTNLDDNTYRIDIKLTFTKDAPTGNYDISDWIPSNSRLYNRGGSRNYDYYQRTEGQKIYFTYNRPAASAGTKILTYTVRQTYRASAMLDTVYVIHGESGVNATSEKALFVPENANLTTPMVHIDPTKNVAPS